MTNRLSTHRDLSAYFEASRAARHSFASDDARFGGAIFSVWAALVDAARLPQFTRWLDDLITKESTRDDPRHQMPSHKP